jgi:hypothetical protein
MTATSCLSASNTAATTAAATIILLQQLYSDGSSVGDSHSSGNNWVGINHLNPSDYFTYHEVWHFSKFYVLFTGFMYKFMWISEETATIFLYVSGLMLLIIEDDCVYW